MQRRIFVLDTNVLMHDPTALFRFEEHDVFLPMLVLEELDAGKKGLSEVARNARQTSRFLDDLVRDLKPVDIAQGIVLHNPLRGQDEAGANGRLLFETHPPRAELPAVLPGHKADNSILLAALSLRSEDPQAQVTLVSKDINLRIKGTVIGLAAEDYSSDQVIEDADLLDNGYQQLPDDFWESHGRDMQSWQETGRTFYQLQGPLVSDWHVNQFLHFRRDHDVQLVVRSLQNNSARLELAHDYQDKQHAVWGINARNREQNFALNLLMDPNIDFVTLIGAAGTGKTLLTLAAGLAQTLDEQRYREIIISRVTVPVGEDIGFLPGTEEEKMAPWMGALMDNLEVLTNDASSSDWERAAAGELLSRRIKIRSINFMRGRTFLHRFIILDEAQNLTPKQMKTLITRAGPGSKVVCIGNLAQIDTPYLTETSSGLTNVIDRFRGWPHAGHVTLARGERSRLADYATRIL